MVSVACFGVGDVSPYVLFLLATTQNDTEYDENFYDQVDYGYDIIGELISLNNVQPAAGSFCL